MRTKQELVRTARESGHRSHEATDPAFDIARWIKKPSPAWPISIGRSAAARMIHLTRTGCGQKENFARGSLPPHHMNDC